jgi:predicted AAA+ superfamily ATPase
MKPWREIAVPHEDVLKGTFQQSEFAADLAKVHDGSAPKEYSDPELFFERTFITEGMKLLLDSVMRRLTGRGGDPVIQLQTAFGGGKTHTLLAVYHLAKATVPASRLSGVSPLLDATGVTELPTAKIVVLDGTRFSPSQPKRSGQSIRRTLWGELAWQLGGAETLAKVAESDENGTAPDASLLEEILSPHQPVVILIDELVAYLRQFEDGRSYPGGTFDSNLTFVQNLTQALKGVPQGMLLVSLPASNISEAGSARGQRALEVLQNIAVSGSGEQSLRNLEKTVGRVHALWKPVGTEEAFEIVRRRLFSRITDEAQALETCRAFTDLYNENRGDLPKETVEARYAERMMHAYPIHPEVFDRLYKDWSSLDNFQRTRGVLKLMAKVIHRLWKDGNNDALVLPGSLPMYDADTRNEMIYYLPQGWDPVVEGDIDGERSETTEIETQDARFGSVQACRRLARAIFLGSAPSTAAQGVRGLEAERIMLGVLQPGQSTGVYKDALRRITDRLHYLNTANNRYWFDVRPNLRREMEDRKRRFHSKEHLVPEIETRLRALIGALPHIGIHVFSASSDIPDDWKMHFVVLPQSAPFSRGANPEATKLALQILDQRGDQPRTKTRNRLLFLAADAESTARLDDLVCTYKAWESITSDHLNLDKHQTDQAVRSRDTASEAANRSIRETYKWLLAPLEEPDGRGGIAPLRWEHFALNTGSKSFSQEIQRVMQENELVIEKWAPVHLDTLLRTWFWKDGLTDIPALDVWQKTCQYLYMPRLKDSTVFASSVAEGAASRDFFGLSQGKRDGKYLAFTFGERTVTHLESNLLIEPSAATAYEAELKQAQEATKPQPTPPAPGTPGPTGKPSGPTVLPTPGATKSRAKRFYGATTVSPLLATKEFAEIVEEVVQQFTTRVGNDVEIRIEIQAKSSTGYDENLQRSVKENCRTLKFNSFEFEAGE